MNVAATPDHPVLRPAEGTRRGDRAGHRVRRAGDVVLRLVPPASKDEGLASLTPRQREVLDLMANGLSNAAIARRLVVTERAVVQHCSNIYSALDLAPSSDEHRRVLAVLRCVAGAWGGAG